MVRLTDMMYYIGSVYKMLKYSWSTNKDCLFFVIEADELKAAEEKRKKSCCCETKINNHELIVSTYGAMCEWSFPFVTLFAGSTCRSFTSFLFLQQERRIVKDPRLHVKVLPLHCAGTAGALWSKNSCMRAANLTYSLYYSTVNKHIILCDTANVGIDPIQNKYRARFTKFCTHFWINVLCLNVYRLKIKQNL